MCTVSVCQLNGQLILSMNRDERRNRHEGDFYIDFPSMAYPTDEPTAGTWCGFNDKGVVMALLNRYQDRNPLFDNPHQQSTTSMISRGNIIPSALPLGDFHHIAHYLEEQDYENRQPFDLVLASPLNIRVYSWTGTEFVFIDVANGNDKVAWMKSSSSVNAEVVLPARQKRFHAWLSQSELSEKFSAGVMPAFHLERTDDASESVYMSRELSHTKSFMQVVVDFKSENELKNHNKLTKICGYYLHESLLLKRQVKKNQAYKFSSDETFLLLENLNELQS